MNHHKRTFTTTADAAPAPTFVTTRNEYRSHAIFLCASKVTRRVVRRRQSCVFKKRGFERKLKMSLRIAARSIDNVSHRIASRRRRRTGVQSHLKQQHNRVKTPMVSRRELRSDTNCFVQILQTLVRLSRECRLLRRGSGTNRILDLTLDAHGSL